MKIILQRINKSEKGMVSTVNYEGIEFPVLEKVIIKLKQKQY